MKHLPDKNGHFGQFGGKYVPETLMPALAELENELEAAFVDDAFHKELADLLRYYVGRPSPLQFASRMTAELGGAKVYLKREDLNHTGAHKINNTIAQLILARRMGKTRIIAETGAGQHGVATATAAALFGLPCFVYMGEEDIARQKLNVFKMRLHGATVVSVTSGSRTLKDAMNEAIRDWVTNVHDTFYVIGSVAGPHPYPLMVREFQAIIGYEAKVQLRAAEDRLPDYCIACVGGGSNAMGLFHEFRDDDSVTLIGVEAGGIGTKPGEHGAPLAHGRVGVIHGSKSYLLYDDDGQITEAHSISAGLDYPGVGPEVSQLKEDDRARFVTITDDEALDAYRWLAATEGIIPALESAHAIAYARKFIPETSKDEVCIINVSGRGDKDIYSVAARLGEELG